MHFHIYSFRSVVVGHFRHFNFIFYYYHYLRFLFQQLVCALPCITYCILCCLFGIEIKHRWFITKKNTHFSTFVFMKLAPHESQSKSQKGNGVFLFFIIYLLLSLFFIPFQKSNSFDRTVSVCVHFMCIELSFPIFINYLSKFEHWMWKHSSTHTNHRDRCEW